MAVSGQSVVSFKPPVCLQRASVVRWGQCYKYMAQTVFGLLLLVHQPAMEESEVITYKALKWNWGKNNENVRCSCCLGFLCIFFDLWCFFHPFCFIHITVQLGFWKIAQENICNHWKHFSVDSMTHTSQAGHKLVSIESMPLLIVDSYSSFVPRAKDMPGLG